MQNKTNLSINVFDFHGNLLAKILLSLYAAAAIRTMQMLWLNGGEFEG